LTQVSKQTIGKSEEVTKASMQRTRFREKPCLRSHDRDTIKAHSQEVPEADLRLANNLRPVKVKGGELGGERNIQEASR
jgi:hypothetical protein